LLTEDILQSPTKENGRHLYEKYSLRPRRDAEYQGMPDRPVRRPHFDPHHGGQPALSVVCLDGLRSCHAICSLALQRTDLAVANYGAIRRKLLKIGALVTVSVRRIKFGNGVPDVRTRPSLPWPTMLSVR
jgi:hypothetical protein